MFSHTFGNPRTFKTLEYISEYVGSLDPYRRAKVSAFLNDFNRLCKDLAKLNEFRPYTIKLAKEDYYYRIRELGYSQELSADFISYLENFVKTKLKLCMNGR